MPWKETYAMTERAKLMLELDTGEDTVSELCRCHGVSRKTVYKWRRRYLLEGLSGLDDRSRAPLHHPQGMSFEVVAAVLEVRHQHAS
ncbi:MAG: helix-turn-helix domain-containing protein, partial [Alphaproteobacteria bacterium]|nr:helix-turn-helix domain-containing protein [Alphaproteobacteria bacterium]